MNSVQSPRCRNTQDGILLRAEFYRHLKLLMYAVRDSLRACIRSHERGEEAERVLDYGEIQRMLLERANALNNTWAKLARHIEAHFKENTIFARSDAVVASVSSSRTSRSRDDDEEEEEKEKEYCNDGRHEGQNESDGFSTTKSYQPLSVSEMRRVTFVTVFTAGLRVVSLELVDATVAVVGQARKLRRSREKSVGRGCGSILIDMLKRVFDVGADACFVLVWPLIWLIATPIYRALVLIQRDEDHEFANDDDVHDDNDDKDDIETGDASYHSYYSDHVQKNRSTNTTSSSVSSSSSSTTSPSRRFASSSRARYFYEWNPQEAKRHIGTHQHHHQHQKLNRNKYRFSPLSLSLPSGKEYASSLSSSSSTRCAFGSRLWQALRLFLLTNWRMHRIQFALQFGIVVYASLLPTMPWARSWLNNNGTLGFWLYLTVILVTLTTVDTTLDRAVQRLLGTGMGIVIALPYAMLGNLCDDVLATLGPLAIVTFGSGLLFSSPQPYLQVYRYAWFMISITFTVLTTCQYQVDDTTSSTTDVCKTQQARLDVFLVRTISIAGGGILACGVSVSLFPVTTNSTVRKSIHGALYSVGACTTELVTAFLESHTPPPVAVDSGGENDRTESTMANMTNLDVLIPLARHQRSIEEHITVALAALTAAQAAIAASEVSSSSRRIVGGFMRRVIFCFVAHRAEDDEDSDDDDEDDNGGKTEEDGAFQSRRETLKAMIVAVLGLLDELIVLFYLINRPPKLSGAYGTSMFDAYLSRCDLEFDTLKAAVAMSIQVKRDEILPPATHTLPCRLGLFTAVRSSVRMASSMISTGSPSPPTPDVRDAYEALTLRLHSLRERYFRELAVLRGDASFATESVISGSCRSDRSDGHLSGANILLNFNIDDAMLFFAVLQGIDNSMRLLFALLQQKLL